VKRQNKSCTETTKSYVVSKGGTGDFQSVQDAINAVPEQSDPITIFIKEGVYQEVVTVPSSKPFISLIGEKAETTIIMYDNYAGKLKDCGRTYGTSGSASMYVFADDFLAENITIENSFDYNQPVDGKQAIAAYTSGKRMIFKQVRFLGHQDTLYASAGTQYFFQCYMKGNVDFIFGAAQAVFEECEIESIDHNSEINGYVTAASTIIHQTYGYLFIRCRLISQAAKQTVFLGRPWHPSGNPNAIASVVFKNCYLGPHIHPDGWTDMSGFKAADARFYEYNNVGPGAWRSESRKQLTADEAKQYSKIHVLDGWEPNC
jgi:pectin methylesterase-like acyl-CoA thioesterase